MIKAQLTLCFDKQKGTLEGRGIQFGNQFFLKSCSGL